MDILVTKRLTLRTPLEVDAEAITAALQNTNVTRNLTNVPSPYAMSDALEWIRKCANDDTSVHFSIYRQRFLGVISVRKNANGEADLGYWLDEQHWGQGLMSEAVRAVVSHAFRKLNLTEIHSGAYADNPASMAVLRKIGFEPTKTVAKHFNPTRNCEVPCERAKLTRERFERKFGSLETKAAA